MLCLLLFWQRVLTAAFPSGAASEAADVPVSQERGKDALARLHSVKALSVDLLGWASNQDVNGCAITAGDVACVWATQQEVLLGALPMAGTRAHFGHGTRLAGHCGSQQAGVLRICQVHWQEAPAGDNTDWVRAMPVCTR